MESSPLGFTPEEDENLWLMNQPLIAATCVFGKATIAVGGSPVGGALSELR
jgi:hypothetical protein